MRRLLLMFALCATAALALAPAALAQQGTDLDCSQLGTPGASPEEAQAILDADPSDPNALDTDGDGIACEFEASSTGEVAFEDGSGFVSDAAAPAAEQYEQEEPSADLDCADFGSSEEAQAALAADPTDPSDIDADGDGVACNELFTEDPPLTAEEPAQYEAPQSPSVEVAPVAPPPGADSPVFQPTEPDAAETATPQASAPEAATPVPPAPQPAPALKQLPATGGSHLLVPALAGVALLLGLGGVAASRRRA